MILLTKINKLLNFFLAISTVEGMLQRTISGLTQDQPVRRHMDPEGAKQIDEYVEKIENLLTVKEAFHIVSFKELEFIYLEKIPVRII